MNSSSQPTPMFENSIYWFKLTPSQTQECGPIHTGENPVWMEIEHDVDGYALFIVAENRKSCSDYFFPSLDDAFHQAKFMCGVCRDEWNKYQH
ncbi:MAG: hypothetical protein JKY43_01615 [Phycisphaerales bacterium]|nr:hypothetical protein [Phycisphaerales bacterium]